MPVVIVAIKCCTAANVPRAPCLLQKYNSRAYFMNLHLLRTKIHRATVTHAELHYEGSCAIDGDLLDLSGIREFEHIHIYNVDNGERFSTYAIRAESGSGIISINGAAAHRAAPGQLVIICAYGTFSEAAAQRHEPKLVYVDADNRVTHTGGAIPVQMA